MEAVLHNIWETVLTLLDEIHVDATRCSVKYWSVPFFYHLLPSSGNYEICTELVIDVSGSEESSSKGNQDDYWMKQNMKSMHCVTLQNIKQWNSIEGCLFYTFFRARKHGISWKQSLSSFTGTIPSCWFRYADNTGVKKLSQYTTTLLKNTSSLPEKMKRKTVGPSNTAQ